MRHQRLRRKLGVTTAHRKALLRNLVRALVIRKRIQTTLAKAKEASSFADQMITLAKRGGLHSRRLLVARLGCPNTADTLITQIAPHFKERQGGYTRIMRLGTRVGDGAETALLEFSTLIEAPAKEKKPKKEKRPKEVKHAHEEAAPEKPKKEKAKEKEAGPKKVEKKTAGAAEGEAKGKEDKKESEKKGGFLSALRKFLKGDEE